MLIYFYLPLSMPDVPYSKSKKVLYDLRDLLNELHNK